MSNPRCVFNAAGLVLRRVFLVPIEHPPTPLLLRSPRFSHPSPFRSNTAPIQRRTFKITTNAVREKRLPRDEEITAPFLRLKKPDQSLDYPRSTARILQSFDRKTHMLQVVAMGEEGEVPIACILDKREAYLQKKAQKKGKKPGSVTKTIEMNWAIEKNDLGHRLEKIRGFLEKGNKVEILLAGKKKGRTATMEEAEEVVRRIREFVGGVEGAREKKAMEGKVGAQAILHFEGKVLATKKEGGEEEEEAEKENEKENEKEKEKEKENSDLIE
ncbi:hypothetical protein DSL72_009402 [Monilinia vaccinii-corymbosi]|uniref:Translation initiation factor 3 N-terminal domain-containing protein n=1 Tax=Monilinia vaccinii-corymbosi TaxID=61207 RepID=A0A8A3PPE6_9HELO|nr:hypothetical protein DSL72_009402 [Monilinia vaccinii-corymbosi]